MDLREAVARALPEGAFIRRDRGRALYVTNAPAKGWRGGVDGFDTAISGGLAYITPDRDTLQRCDFEPDRLAVELSAMKGASDEAVAIFSACVKCAEAPTAGEFEKCDRLLRQAAAVALRRGGGEGLYYCALALAEARRRLTGQRNGGK